MSVVKEVFEELWSMFVGDRRLTLLLLAVVALAALVAFVIGQKVVADAVILIGAIAVLADSVLAAARKSR
jgi:hypothetical protein